MNYSKRVMLMIQESYSDWKMNIFAFLVEKSGFGGSRCHFPNLREKCCRTVGSRASGVPWKAFFERTNVGVGNNASPPRSTPDTIFKKIARLSIVRNRGHSEITCGSLSNTARPKRASRSPEPAEAGPQFAAPSRGARPHAWEACAGLTRNATAPGRT